MNLFDHLFVLIFAVIYPIAGFIGYRRFLEKIKAGMPANRSRLYIETTSWQWVLFALGAIAWGIGDRSFSQLGMDFELNNWVLIGAALIVMVIGFFFVQIRQVAKASRKELQNLESAFGEMSILMPVNGSELARFNMTSLTAGIVEETLWRGFLFWYLGHVMPLWGAAIVSAVGFGLAHSYQGLAYIPRVAMIGAVFSGLYLLTGSLWLSIILHAVVDLLQGRLAYEVLRRKD